MMNSLVGCNFVTVGSNFHKDVSFKSDGRNHTLGGRNRAWLEYLTLTAARGAASLCCARVVDSDCSGNGDGRRC